MQFEHQSSPHGVGLSHTGLHGACYINNLGMKYFMQIGHMSITVELTRWGQAGPMPLIPLN